MRLYLTMLLFLRELRGENMLKSAIKHNKALMGYGGPDLHKFVLRSQFQNIPFCPISASVSNFSPPEAG